MIPITRLCWRPLPLQILWLLPTQRGIPLAWLLIMRRSINTTVVQHILWCGWICPATWVQIKYRSALWNVLQKGVHRILSVENERKQLKESADMQSRASRVTWIVRKQDVLLSLWRNGRKTHASYPMSMHRWCNSITVIASSERNPKKYCSMVFGTSSLQEQYYGAHKS